MNIDLFRVGIGPVRAETRTWSNASVRGSPGTTVLLIQPETTKKYTLVDDKRRYDCQGRTLLTRIRSKTSPWTSRCVVKDLSRLSGRHVSAFQLQRVFLGMRFPGQVRDRCATTTSVLFSETQMSEPKGTHPHL